jgi:predicted  nucleic acid-binding Zn-ribbon protein
MAILICPNGHQNPEGKGFCQECGSKLVNPSSPSMNSGGPPDALFAQLKEDVERANKEGAWLKQSLAASEQNVASLKQQLGAALERKGAHAPAEHGQSPIADRDRSIVELQQKLNGAEERKKNLENEYRAKIRQLEEALTKKTSSQEGAGTKGRPYAIMSLIAGGALLLAGLAAVGGYRAGRRVPNKVELQKEQVLSALSVRDEEDLQTLRTQLIAAQQKADKLSSDLAAMNVQAQTTNGKNEQLQQKLNALQTQLTQKLADEKQRRQELATQAEKLAQVSQELTTKTNQTAALQQIVDRHPMWNYKGPVQGVIRWSADLRKDKSLLVNFDHGRITNPDGDAAFVPLDAQLPGVPVTVQPLDKNVFIAVAPAANNGWQRIALRVDGKKGRVEIRVAWTVVN